MKKMPKTPIWLLPFFALIATYCANSPLPAISVDSGTNDLATRDLTPIVDLKISPDMTPPDGPNGFKPILWEDKNGKLYKGIILYKKDYEGGQPDYVWVINLQQGAKFRSYTNPVASPPNNTDGPGPFPTVGPNPNFTKRNLDQTVWGEIQKIRPEVIGVMNGSFFDAIRPYTPAPFTIKQDGIVQSSGNNLIKEYGYQGYIRLLRISHNTTQADVVDFDKDATAYQNQINGFDTVIGGLAKDAAKLNPTSLNGRIMVATNRYMVYVFSSALSKCVSDPMKTDDGGAEILEKFGGRADQILNMDGGSSTRMVGLDKNNVFTTYVSRPQNGPLPFYLYVSSGN